MAEIIAVANQKGGMGKTTTALAVSQVLRMKGNRVLYCDLDPQCNGTDNYRAKIDGVGTMYDLLIHSDADCIQRTEMGDIIPGDPLLKDASKHLDGVSATYKLREGLEEISNSYDFIILDTPPALGILLQNALTAANRVVISLTSDRFGLQGLVQLNDTIREVKKYANPGLVVDGLLLVRYSDRTNLAKDIVDNLPAYAERFNTRIYNTRIRESIKAREAQAAQKSLFEWAPGSTTAQDYVDLTNEILGGINNG